MAGNAQEKDTMRAGSCSDTMPCVRVMGLRAMSQQGLVSVMGCNINT